jgi:hypothetical protein
LANLKLLIAGGAASAGGLLAADSADLRHMPAVGAHRLASLSACRPGFIRGELVRGAFLMSRFTPLSCDFALSAAIHGRKSTILSFGLHPYSLYWSFSVITATSFDDDKGATPVPAGNLFAS